MHLMSLDLQPVRISENKPSSFCSGHDGLQRTKNGLTHLCEMSSFSLYTCSFHLRQLILPRGKRSGVLYPSPNSCNLFHFYFPYSVVFCLIFFVILFVNALSSFTVIYHFFLVRRGVNGQLAISPQAIFKYSSFILRDHPLKSPSETYLMFVVPGLCQCGSSLAVGSLLW